MLSKIVSRYFPISLIFITLPTHAMKFSSTINQMKLPLLMSVEQPPQIKYVPPGQISLSARRFCGDGDVAHFASENPSFEFVPSDAPKLDVIVGYWIVESNNLNPLIPDQNNWYPIAYNKIDITGSNQATTQTVTLNRFNHLPNTANGLTVIKNELKNVYSVARDSYLSSKSYNLYASVISCVGPDHSEEMDQTKPYKASPIEIINSLSNIESGLGNYLEDYLKSIDEKKNETSKLTKIKIIPINPQPDNFPKPYEYRFGDEGIEINGNGKLLEHFQNIMSISYPVDSDGKPLTDIIEFKKQLSNNSVKADIAGFDRPDKLSYCNRVGAMTNANVKTYTNLEPFIMNLTCKNLIKDLDLSYAFRDLFYPNEIPNKNLFDANKKNLARRFLVAAGYQSVQSHFNSSLNITRTGCLKKPNQSSSIHRIVASYPLKFKLENHQYALKAHPSNHLHPESLFAIRDFGNYFNHDFLGIWGQVQPNQGPTDITLIKDENSILLPLNDKSLFDTHKLDDASFNGVPININFKVRSVGGSCNGTIYC